MHSAPVMIVSPSATSPATASAMARRWSRWLSTTAPCSGVGPSMAKPSRELLDMGAELAQLRLPGSGDAIGLLDPQLGCVMHGGHAMGLGGGDGQNGQLIDQSWNLVAGDRRRLQVTRLSRAEWRPARCRPEAAASCRMFAPMRCRASRMPVRVGLTPTLLTGNRAAGNQAGGDNGKAADEMSPGTLMSKAAGGRVGGSTMTVVPSLRTVTPRARSMRSLWSRLGAGSRTVVAPRRRARPAGCPT